MKLQTSISLLESLTGKKVVLKETTAAQLQHIHRADKDPKWKEVVSLQTTWDIVKAGLSNANYDMQWEQLLNSKTTATDMLPKLMKIWTSFPDDVIISAIEDVIHNTFSNLSPAETAKLSSLAQMPANNLLINELIKFYNLLKANRVTSTNPLKVGIDKIIQQIATIEDDYQLTRVAANTYQKILNQFTDSKTKQINYSQDLLDELKDFMRTYKIQDLYNKTVTKRSDDRKAKAAQYDKEHEKVVTANAAAANPLGNTKGLFISGFSTGAQEVIQTYGEQLQKIVGSPISYSDTIQRKTLTPQQEKAAAPLIARLEQVTKKKVNF